MSYGVCIVDYIGVYTCVDIGYNWILQYLTHVMYICYKSNQCNY